MKDNCEVFLTSQLEEWSCPSLRWGRLAGEQVFGEMKHPSMDVLMSRCLLNIQVEMVNRQLGVDSGFGLDQRRRGEGEGRSFC